MDFIDRFLTEKGMDKTIEQATAELRKLQNQ